MTFKEVDEKLYNLLIKSAEAANTHFRQYNIEEMRVDESTRENWRLMRASVANFISIAELKKPK